MWARFVNNLSIRQLFSLLGDVSIAIAIVVPWIYGLSAPVGQSYQVHTVAAANLLDLVYHSDYGYLIWTPLALVPGLLFVLLPKKRKGLGTLLVIAAFLLAFVPSFEFGIQFGGERGLLWDGSYISFAITLGPGVRVMELGTTLYFFSLLIMLITED